MLKIQGGVTGLAILLGWLVLALTGFTTGSPTGVAVDPTATPASMMPSVEDRLSRPTLPAQPNQADLGSQVYYYVCMACHGDQGQGLTPEWIASWEIGDKPCWQSRCHASNHPPEGFKLPEYIPAVVSPAVIGRFANALELHDYLVQSMPWQAPGTLTAEEYWQLTAYLVRENGIDPGPLPLNHSKASKVGLRPAVQVTPTPMITEQAGAGFWYVGGAVLVLVVSILLVKNLWTIWLSRGRG
jgi:cytochrome c5